MEEYQNDQPKEFTGVWIPRHIIEDDDLNMTDKIIYAEIACFEICHKSNEKLGERYKLKADTISRVISKLIKKGYVESKGVKEGRFRQLLAVRDLPTPRQGRKIILGTLGKKSYPPLENNPTIDNSIDNNKDNLDIAKAISTDKGKEIQKVMDVFYKVNPSLNWAHKGHRTACTWLVAEIGLEGTLDVAKYAVSLLGQKYAPVITTPSQLKEKLTQLISYKAKNTIEEFTGE